VDNHEFSNSSGPLQGWRFEELTPRERDVAELIAEGLSNEQIAQRLVLTPGTVANHVAHILAKLGVQSRVQIAVRMASDGVAHKSGAVLELLSWLRQIDTASVEAAFQHVADVLATTFGAEKADAFLLDPAQDMLVALGTSRTPLGDRQRALGLNRLPIAGGGRIVWVFNGGRPFLDGDVENDDLEHIAVWRDLGIRSTLAAPFRVTPDERGVLALSSRQPQRFDQAQLELLEFVAYWVGLVAREQASTRARQLAEESTREA
jgi:DNA-binding CsgD family transcriptional regulator/uncharacterized protein YigA (DUF484 family)